MACVFCLDIMQSNSRKQERSRNTHTPPCCSPPWHLTPCPRSTPVPPRRTSPRSSSMTLYHGSMQKNPNGPNSPSFPLSRDRIHQGRRHMPRCCRGPRGRTRRPRVSRARRCSSQGVPRRGGVRRGSRERPAVVAAAPWRQPRWWWWSLSLVWWSLWSCYLSN